MGEEEDGAPENPTLSDEDDSESEVLPKVKIVNLSKLQEPDADSDSPTPVNDSVASTSSGTRTPNKSAASVSAPIIVDLTTPKKNSRKPRRRNLTNSSKSTTSSSNTPRKKSATPRKTATPGTPKAPVSQKKLFAKGTGMKVGAINKYLVPKHETKKELVVLPLEIIPSTSNNENVAPDVSNANVNVNNNTVNANNGASSSNNPDLDLSDVSSDSFSSGDGAGPGQGSLSSITSNPLSSETKDPSSSLPMTNQTEIEVIDISDSDDEGGDRNTTQDAAASLVLQPTSSVFNTPVKGPTSPATPQGHVFALSNTDYTPIDVPMDTSTSAIDPSPRTSHIRSLIFSDKPGLSGMKRKSIEPNLAVIDETEAEVEGTANDVDLIVNFDVDKSILEVQSELDIPVVDETPTAGADIENSIAAAMTNVEKSIRIGVSDTPKTTTPEVQAATRTEAPPANPRFPLVPPRQKNSAETKRRVEAHYKRMEEEGASLSEVGLASDVESSNSTGTENDCPNQSRLGGNPVKITRRRKKRFTHVKGSQAVSRRASLQSSGSNSSDEPSTSSGRKRSHSDAGLLESESASGKSIKNSHLGGNGKGGPEPGNITSLELAKMIERCFLKRSPRDTATKQEQTLALERFKSLTDECKDMKLYLDAFLALVKPVTITNDEQTESVYFEIITELFRTAFKETLCRASTKDQSAIQFLDLFCKLMEANYEIHSNLGVKLSLPLVGWIMQGHESAAHPRVGKSNATKSFKSMVHIALLFQDTPSDEFGVCMNWLNFVVKYYYDYCRVVDPYLSEWEMVKGYLEEVAVTLGRFVYTPTPGRSSDNGLEVLKNIKVPKYGRSISAYIILNALNFQLSDEFKDESKYFPFFRDLAQSSLVLVMTDTEKPPKGDLNRKGESIFHQACQDAVSFLQWEVGLLLKDELGLRNINTIDNAGNSCLHDAVYYGKLDIIQYLDKTCYKPDEKPGKKNLDLLLPNSDGNTPLHIAVQRAELNDQLDVSTNEPFSVVRKLIEMIQKKSMANKMLSIAFQMKNEKGQTLLDCCPKSDFGKSLSAYLTGIKDGIHEPSTFGGIDLEPEAIEKIRASPVLQTLIAYWELFDSEQKPYDRPDSELSDLEDFDESQPIIIRG